MDPGVDPHLLLLLVIAGGWSREYSTIPIISSAE